jgi:excisionase family DNA binding protein
MSIKKHLLTRKQAAEYLGLHSQTLAKWASTGSQQLRYLKIGNRTFYRQSDLDAWVKSRERTQVEA